MKHQALTTYRALLDAAAVAPGKREDNPECLPVRIVIPTGDRSSMTVCNTRERLQELADHVRKHWTLYGGGPKPDDLKPKPRKASAWPMGLVRCWLGQMEDEDHAGAMLTAEQLGVWYALVGNTPDSHARGFVAPQHVEGMPERIVSACRDDGRWVVMDRVSGQTICNQKARSRANAEADALARLQDMAERRSTTPDAFLADALARVAPAADGLDQWRERWGLVDVAPVAEPAQPRPEVAPELDQAQPVPVVAPVLDQVQPVPEVAPELDQVQPVSEVAPTLAQVQPVPEVAPTLDQAKPLRNPLQSTPPFRPYLSHWRNTQHARRRPAAGHAGPAGQPLQGHARHIGAGLGRPWAGLQKASTGPGQHGPGYGSRPAAGPGNGPGRAWHRRPAGAAPPLRAAGARLMQGKFAPGPGAPGRPAACSRGPGWRAQAPPGVAASADGVSGPTPPGVAASADVRQHGPPWPENLRPSCTRAPPFHFSPCPFQFPAGAFHRILITRRLTHDHQAAAL